MPGPRRVVSSAQDTVDRAVDNAAEGGRRLQHSPAYRWGVRIGLWCYGLVHLLMAFLALQILRGAHVDASNQGSLTTLAQFPLGHVLIAVISVGMAALTLWMVLEAAFGYAWLDGTKRLVRRISCAGRAVVYASVAAGAFTLAQGHQVANGNSSGRKAARDLLAMPFGQALLWLVAIVTAVVAADQVQRGVRRSFLKYDLQGSVPGWATWLGVVGWVAKGITLLLVAGLFVAAATTHDASRAGGFDLALRSLRGMVLGKVLLALVALGTACFGIFCFVWAQHPRHDAQAS